MLGIFFAPRARFQQLSTRPEWSVPLVIALVAPFLLATLTTSLLPKQVLINSIESRVEKVKNYIDEQVEGGRIPSDQRSAAITRIEETSRREIEFYEHSSWFSLFLRFLVRSLPVLVWSAIQIFVFTALLNLLLPVLGSGSNFGRMLALTANSALVRIGKAVVDSVLMVATGKLMVNTSMGLFLPVGPIFLRGLLSTIDIFTIWELVLVGLGMKVFFNLRDQRPWFAVFGIWLVYILLLALLTTLSGGLALAS